MTTATPNVGFATKVTDQAPDAILPQKAGGKLWAPMFAMGLMGFVVAIVLAGFKTQAVADGDVQSAAALGQFTTAAMFLGFAAVFAAISFAIARILGEFRVGGGSVQESAGSTVETLKMPGSAKVFLGGMMMAMMIIVGAVILHVVLGAQINSGDASALANAEEYSLYLEAARRFGVGLYLFAIAFGLATIISVLRFQAVRIRQIATN
jgi:hypothetical protein